MVGVGIVGFGYWGPNYLRVLKQLNEVDYIAVCDSDVKKLEPLSDVHVARYSSYDALIQDTNLSAVVVATPPQTHYDIAKQALSGGKHVLLEKPMTLSAAHARELIELAKLHKKTLAVGHIFLYNDGINFLKSQIYGDEFGKIHEIECVRQGHGPIRSEINVLWDLATHDVAILLGLLKRLPLEVSATGFKYRVDAQQEDSVVVCLHFSDNVNAVIKANWQYPIKERRVTVIGEHKMIRFSDSDINAPITVYDKSVVRHGEQSEAEFGAFKMITKDGGYHVPATKMREPLLLQMRDFLDAIANNTEPLSGGEIGLNVVRVLEAATQSLMQGGGKVRLSAVQSPKECVFGDGVQVGEGTIMKNVDVGKNSKVWHNCNVYGDRNHRVKIGENCQIGSFSEIKPNVQIGNNCRMQSYVFIPEMVRIEDNVFIGPGVRFHNDKYPSAVKTLQGTWKCEPTVVKEHASIGGGVLIAPGITIGRCAVVGLGSVVIKDVPDYGIVVGNPARVVGDVRDAKYAAKYPEFLGGK